MAGPIRFRYSTERWNADTVTSKLYAPLSRKFDVEQSDPRISPPPGYEARRFTMGPTHFALFAWQTDEAGAYWLGNTETPEALWRTDKFTFAETPYPIARWAQRILLADLEVEEPWLTEFPYVAWFFLPVFFSKDGSESTRAFFRDHAAGFPDASREDGLACYEDVLSTGLLDDYRYVMASKLGTSERIDLVRMRATMAELNAAKLLASGGYQFVPEVEQDSGYTLDFRLVGAAGEAETSQGPLLEVTRPEPPTRRRAGTPAQAMRETVDGKRGNQLAAHDDAVVLVDCTSFRDDEWQSVLAERPSVGHTPAIVYRMRPNRQPEGYAIGHTGLDLEAMLQE